MNDKAHIPYHTARRFLIDLIKNNDFSGDDEIIKLLHSILQGKSCLNYFTDGVVSRIRIDKETRIFLLDYSDQEVKMPCLPKTVFLLFLIHPEGVNFKGMRAYLQELYNIYQIVMKKNIEADKIKQILSNLVDPMSNSIYEACSIIRNRLLKVAGPSRKKGTHTYRVEAPMYASDAGVVDLGNEQKIMSVTLKPRFGYLEVFSLPEQDAKVYIDSILVGQTPYKSDRLPLRSYHVKVEKDFFFPIDTLLNVSAGATTTHTFRMVSTIKPKEPRRTLVMLEAGYHPSQTSFGGMVGFVGTNGAYIRFRSDFGSASAELECDDTGELTSGGTGIPYYKEGVTKKARMSVTAGYMRRLAKPLYAYVGAGYGNRTLAWETVEDELVKNTDHSASGIAAEVGAIGRLGKFAVSVGFQTVGFKYHELSAGLGFFF